MIALYPSYPSRPREPDPAFGWEVQWAKSAGFKIAFVDLELQLGGDVVLRRLPEGDDDVIYRGWIIKPDDYARLDEKLQEQGKRLVESVDAYREAYEFPRWYRKIWGEWENPWKMTPRSIWLPKEGAGPWGSALLPDGSFDLSEVAHIVRRHFDSRACLLKDWIKSRKQDWFEACFIPDARDTENVKKIVSRFIELNDGTLTGGLVFREFETFKRIGTHPKTQMPVINEWRGFMVNGKCAYLAPYWASGDYSNVIRPDPVQFEAVCARAGFVSSFLALDMAERVDGSWSVIEINSGGSAGVPEGGNTEDFYRALASAY